MDLLPLAEPAGLAELATPLAFAPPGGSAPAAPASRAQTSGAFWLDAASFEELLAGLDVAAGAAEDPATTVAPPATKPAAKHSGSHENSAVPAEPAASDTKPPDIVAMVAIVPTIPMIPTIAAIPIVFSRGIPQLPSVPSEAAVPERSDLRWEPTPPAARQRAAIPARASENLQPPPPQAGAQPYPLVLAPDPDMPRPHDIPASGEATELALALPLLAAAVKSPEVRQRPVQADEPAPPPPERPLREIAAPIAAFRSLPEPREEAPAVSRDRLWQGITPSVPQLTVPQLTAPGIPTTPQPRTMPQTGRAPEHSDIPPVPALDVVAAAPIRPEAGTTPPAPRADFPQPVVRMRHEPADGPPKSEAALAFQMDIRPKPSPRPFPAEAGAQPLPPETPSSAPAVRSTPTPLAPERAPAAGGTQAPVLAAMAAASSSTGPRLEQPARDRIEPQAQPLPAAASATPPEAVPAAGKSAAPMPQVRPEPTEPLPERSSQQPSPEPWSAPADRTASRLPAPAGDERLPPSGTSRTEPEPAVFAARPAEGSAAPGDLLMIPREGAAPAPAGPQPARDPEAPRAAALPSELAAELAPPPPEPARPLSFALRSPDLPEVRIRLREHAGQVELTVHSNDTAMRSALRDNLQELVTNLDRHGYSAEPASPGGDRKREPAGHETAEPGLPEIRLREAEPAAERGTVGEDRSGSGDANREEWMWRRFAQDRSKRAGRAWNSFLQENAWQFPRQ